MVCVSMIAVQLMQEGFFGGRGPFRLSELALERQVETRHNFCKAKSIYVCVDVGRGGIYKTNEV